MLLHYMGLAIRSLRRNPVLTVLMILATAIGIGAAMTTLSVYRMLSADPIPEKSERLFRVHMHKTAALSESERSDGWHIPEVISTPGAHRLLREKRGLLQSAVYNGKAGVIHPEQPDSTVITAFVAGTSDFFSMFLVPIRHGAAWSPRDDEEGNPVVVLSHELNQRLFKGRDSTGRLLQLVNGLPPLRVVGVAGRWERLPKVHQPSNMFDTTPELFLPEATAHRLGLNPSGTSECSKSDDGLPEECVHMNYWVELAPGTEQTYKGYLQSHAASQHPEESEITTEIELIGLRDWLKRRELIPADFYLQLWLAFGFLAACQINMAGLLMAKFSQRASEIGIRRALGAGRTHIFAQFIAESALIGTFGGMLGIAFTALGLWGIGKMPTTYTTDALAVDWAMALTSICIAMLVSLISGLLPSWHATHVAPAIQVKSQ